MPSNNIIIGTALDLSGLKKGESQLKNKVADLQKKFSGALDSTAKMAAGVTAISTAAVLATKAIKDLADKTASHADNIGKASQRMGVSIEFYQKMDSAAKHAGTSIGTMETAMRRLLLKMTQVEQGNKLATKAFEDIGVSVHDANGNMRDQEDVFTDTLLALSRMENATERNAKAQEVLGRNASELAPLFDEGEEAVLKYVKANNSAVIVSAELSKASARYNDAMLTLKETWDKQINTSLEPFIEMMADIAESFTPETVENYAETVGIAFTAILKAGSILLAGINSITGMIQYAFNASITGITRAVVKVTDIIADQAEAWNTVLGFVTGKGSVEFLDKAISQMRSFESLTDNIADNLAKQRDEELLAANERQEAIKKYILKIQKATSEAKKLSSSMPSGSKKSSKEQTGSTKAESFEDYTDFSWVEGALAEIVAARKKARDEFINGIIDIREEEEKQEKLALEVKKQQQQDATNFAIENAQLAGDLMMSISEAAISRDEAELNSWKKKEYEKLKTLKVNAKMMAKEKERIDKAAEEREKEIAKKRAKLQIAQAWSDVARGIVGVWSQDLSKFGSFGVPLATASTALLTGIGVAQTASIASQSEAFRDGGVVGGFSGSTAGADNTFVMARKGEMYLNASQQKSLFNMINKGEKSGGSISITRGDIIIQGNVTEDTIESIRQVNDEFVYSVKDAVNSLYSSGELDFA